MKTETSSTEPVMRILKTGTCLTLSGKSKLTYHIGSDDKSEIQIRVQANSSSGYFNKEWIPLSPILAILKKYPIITAFSLRELYAGKSTNSPGFLLAVLKGEGLVKLKGEKERVHVPMDPGNFKAAMKALMEAKPDVGASTGTAAIKKASSSKNSPK